LKSILVLLSKEKTFGGTCVHSNFSIFFSCFWQFFLCLNLALKQKLFPFMITNIFFIKFVVNGIYFVSDLQITYFPLSLILYYVSFNFHAGILISWTSILIAFKSKVVLSFHIKIVSTFGPGLSICWQIPLFVNHDLVKNDRITSNITANKIMWFPRIEQVFRNIFINYNQSTSCPCDHCIEHFKFGH